MGEEEVLTSDPLPPAAGSPDDDAKQVALRIRERIRDGVVAALLDIPALSDPQARSLLVELVTEAAARRVSLREQPTAQLQLVELFRFCAGVEGGVSSLARSVPAIERDSPQTEVVARLADEWNALDAVPDLVLSWDLLERVLGGLRLPWQIRTGLVQEASNHQLPVPPTHSVSPWTDLLFLMGQNAAPECVPPWMLYLDRVTHWMDHSVAREIQARNRKWAFAWEISGDLDRARWGRPAPALPVGRRYQEYLAIQISPDPLENDCYTVSHSFLTEARDRGWEPGDAIHRVPRAELEQVVSRLVTQVERAKGDRAAHLGLEFVLPFELLNLPVDWWPRDASETPGVPLALEYPVVVRSLDRLLNGDWHRRWRNRWDELLTGEVSTGSVCMNAGQDLDAGPRSLEARLSDERCVALVLSEPPGPGREQGHREIKAALRSGLPVVIWHRTEIITGEFQRTLEELLAGGLQNLPKRVSAYRRQVAGLPPESQGRQLGRNLTVLWDDPDRKPIPTTLY